MKRAVFSIWLLVWLAMCLYGFRIMPHGLAVLADSTWSAITSTGLPMLMDARPGALGLGPLALISGGLITWGIYRVLFRNPEDRDRAD